MRKLARRPLILLGAFLTAVLAGEVHAAPFFTRPFPGPGRTGLVPAVPPFLSRPLPGPLTVNPSLFNPAFSSGPLVNPNLVVASGVTLNQAAFNLRVMGNALQSIPPYALGFNPYAPAVTSYGYAAAPGYGPATSPGYGYSSMTSGSNDPYGYQMENGQLPSGTAVAPAPAASTERRNVKASALLRLEKKEGGLDWPLALRILPPALETNALRQELDTLVERAQATSDKVDSSLLREANRDVDQLQKRLADRADSLPTSQQATTDAQEFIRKLREALKALE